MERLNAAVERFNAALDALEGSCEATANRTVDAGAHRELSLEIAELKAERERLLARIATFEEESQSLAGLAEAVETRLDGAISEIRTALGRS